MALTSRLEELQDDLASVVRDRKDEFAALFGEILVAIHHVGSTSIPGMIAKPEIDILVVLKEHEDLHSYFSKIEAIGYDFRGEDPE